MSMIESQIRAANGLVRIELLEVREFCREAESFFKLKLKKLDREIKKFEKRVSEEVMDEEDNANDHYLSDQRMELEGRVELTGYFGIIMVFSTLERFLHRIYEHTMHLAVEPELVDVVLWSSRNKWLNFGDFRGFLKQLGVDGKKFDWPGIKKLHQLRNAIVHQGGMVTEANLNSLSPYGYKESQRVKAPMSYVQESIKLVEKSTKEIGDAYLSALVKKKLITLRGPKY
jgi:hypothetical protein